MLCRARDPRLGGVILACLLCALSVVFVVIDIRTAPELAGPETGSYW